MALSGVLSAIRELILDTDSIPTNSALRQKEYSSRFPLLSSEEIEDLAKIPGEKIKIYTRTVFNGEAKTLRNHFSLTLGLLKQAWPKIFQNDFDQTQLVKMLHRCRPWKSNTTAALAENFRWFLLQAEPRLTQETPALADTSLIELRTIEVRRHADDQIEAANGLQIADLAPLTVAQTLALKCQVPNCARFETFEHDVITALNNFRKNPDNLPTIIKTKVFACGSRNSDRLARWVVAPKEIYQFLAARERAKPFLFEELAEVFVTHCAAGMGEQEAFRNLLEVAGRLIGNGGVVIDSQASAR